MDDEGKTTEGKEELSAKNKDRRADNRKEEVRWGKVVRRRKENSSFVRFSHFLVRCLLPFGKMKGTGMQGALFLIISSFFVFIVLSISLSLRLYLSLSLSLPHF